MKKSKLLILLTASSVAAVTAVVLAPKGSGSKLSAATCDGNHFGYHYSYVAATAETNGRKEYWKCCTDNEIFFTEPSSGTFLEGSDSYFGEEDAIIPAHAYHDDDQDGKCDEPGCLEVDSVSGRIITPLTYMGRGEILNLSSEVTTTGNATSAVKFELSTTSTNFTLYDNEDGTAFIATTAGTSTSSNNITVRLKSKFDNSVLDSFVLCLSTYGSDKRKTITDFFGVDDFQIIPYFIGTTFKSSFNSLSQVSSNANGHDTFEKVLGAFKNQELWTVVSEGKDTATIQLANPNDAGQYFEGVLTRNGTGTNVEYTINDVIFESFPSEEVKTYVSSLGATGTVPAFNGGTYYFLVKNNGYGAPGVTVLVSNVPEALESYISTLEDSGWFAYKESSGKVYYGYEGKTLLINPYSYYDEELHIDFSKNPTPVEKPMTSWPASDVAQVISDLGADGTLPAFDGAKSYKIETPYDLPAVAAYVDDTSAALISYVNTLESSGYFVFQSDGYYDYYGAEGKTLVVCPYTSSGKLMIELGVSDAPISKPMTEWPATEVANALGSLAEETALPASGTMYKVSGLETNGITIEVTGSDTAYVTALKNANYSVVSETPYYRGEFLSPTGTISVYVEYDSWGDGLFSVRLVSHLAPGVSTEFPLEDVKKIIGSTEADNIVSAEGTKFMLTENKKYDVSVEVEGGNKAAFESALTSAGFDSFMAGSYFKGNLCCDVTQKSSSFVINYYLGEEPETPTGFWETFIGDTIENPLKIENGMGGKQNFILKFNSGTIVGYTKNYEKNTTVTFTSDYVGCEDGQLHLTACDDFYNYLDYDFIVSYDESTSKVVLVSDNTASNWS